MAATATGLVVVYRWAVASGQEGAFAERWQAATRALAAEGGLGSCLTRDGDGHFVALAAWPDAQTRTAAMARLSAQAPLEGVTRLSETVLTVEQDLWLRSPFRMEKFQP